MTEWKATMIAALCALTLGASEFAAAQSGEPTQPAKSPFPPRLTASNYHGWKTQCLSNGWLEIHIVPEIGGRVVQLKAGTKEFFWVNPELAGRLSPPSGLALDGGWLNFGGDKLWPAPQGWDGPHQWPGPPDAVLDGQPYSFEKLPSKEGEVAVLGRAKLRTETVKGQWSRRQAWDWYERQPWLIGCNFLTSTAVNDIEMWQADTFDPTTIDRELKWAHKLGFNTVRVFLNYVVWQDDPAGLKQRFEQFLKLADKHQIAVMAILFDDCNFANRVAKAGPQPDPVPGVHNSQWVSSPPLAMVTDRGAWSELERYTKDVVGTFGQDRRVLIWDLYNEPGNSRMGDKSLPLVEAVFAWARASNPQQPLTIGAWANLNSRMSRRMMELSDIVSFHGYDQLSGVQDKIAICREYDRPVLCTEWLHRPNGNTVERILPVFQAQRIGCYNWGLVYGRTQTYMPWGSKPNAPVPALWQHDLFHADGKAFHQEELKLIRRLVNRSKSRS